MPEMYINTGIKKNLSSNQEQKIQKEICKYRLKIEDIDVLNSTVL